MTYTLCDRSVLAPADVPFDLNSEHVAQACRLDVQLELTLPYPALDLAYGSPADEAYRAIFDSLNQASQWTQHRLLGHAQVIQNPMELECQLVSNGLYGGSSDVPEGKTRALESGAVDWRLLLQIDSDEDGPGWMWGDGGRLYFWIRRQDLTALRFEDVWLVLQCY